MADRIPKLKIVRPPDARPPRRRWPGSAVVLIILYAGIFAAGLWWFKSASPLLRQRATDRRAGEGASGAKKTLPPSPPASDAAARVVRRASLLAGEGLSESARTVYVRRIASEKCDCGCELTLQACLARDRACSRSPRLAETIRVSLAAQQP